MTEQDQSPSASIGNNEIELAANAASGKRKYVEPEISQPVDVLEATTFFQLTDSGGTN